MYDNYTISRCDAMEWLAKNLVEWPTEIVDGRTDNIGWRLHEKWSFMRFLGGEIIFAYRLSPCITEADFYNFLHNYAGTELVRYGNEN